MYTTWCSLSDTIILIPVAVPVPAVRPHSLTACRPTVCGVWALASAVQPLLASSQTLQTGKEKKLHHFWVTLHSGIKYSKWVFFGHNFFSLILQAPYIHENIMLMKYSINETQSIYSINISILFGRISSCPFYWCNTKANKTPSLGPWSSAST